LPPALREPNIAFILYLCWYFFMANIWVKKAKSFEEAQELDEKEKDYEEFLALLNKHRVNGRPGITPF